jgi:hypothetical protein
MDSTSSNPTRRGLLLGSLAAAGGLLVPGTAFGFGRRRAPRCQPSPPCPTICTRQRRMRLESLAQLRSIRVTDYQWVFVNVASGKVLDVTRQQIHEDGARLQQWDEHDGPNQLWRWSDGHDISQLINIESGKLLDADLNHISENGANIQQWDRTRKANQNWHLEQERQGVFRVVNQMSGKVLDVELQRINENGARVQQWDFWGGNNQLWELWA